MSIASTAGITFFSTTFPTESVMMLSIFFSFSMKLSSIHFYTDAPALSAADFIACVKLIIPALFLKQLFMISTFYDASLLQNHDTVGVLHRRKPVGNYNWKRKNAGYCDTSQAANQRRIQQRLLRRIDHPGYQKQD